jgi:uncharacterized protein YjbI with pentapeptide repeats
MRRVWRAVVGSWLLVAGVLGVVGLLWVVLVAAPSWFVQHRSLEVVKAQNEVRTTLLQGFGGVVLLFGAYFTYRQLTNSGEQLAHSREQLQMAQQGQITERFTRAIDQLGHAQLDVRLGGIYALERIARDSPVDHATIGEVLTAYIRSHAPWPPTPPSENAAVSIDQVGELQARAPDVQASLTVLGRGGFAEREGQGGRLDLHGVDLRHAHLASAHLEGATFRDAHLEGADLTGAHLERVDFWDAHLQQADLGNAHLGWADLRGADLHETLLGDAHLERANLAGAHLQQANLYLVHLESATLRYADLRYAFMSGAHFEKADLVRANLEEANLSDAQLELANLGGAHLERAELRDAHLGKAYLGGAHLEQADLSGAHLEGAVSDLRTNWPDGFDWCAAGVVLEGGDTAADKP